MVELTVSGLVIVSANLLVASRAESRVLDLEIETARSKALQKEQPMVAASAEQSDVELVSY